MRQEEIFGKAKWICGDAHPLFRQTFSAETDADAKLTVIGLGGFEVYLNGARISEDLFLPLCSDFEERDFPKGEKLGHRIYCCRFDLQLKKGKNAFCLMLGGGWYDVVSGSDIPWGKEKAIWSLSWTEKGQERTVVSDSSVKQHPYFMQSSTLRRGEFQDYTGWDDGMLSPLYDDAAWKNAAEAEAVKSDYLFSDCPPDRVVSRIVPTVVSKTEEGVVYDVGKNLTGIPVLKTASGCGKVEVVFSESLLPDGQPDPKRVHRQYFSCCGTTLPATVRPRFTWYGFRYFRVCGNAEVTEVWEVHSDVAVTSEFSCSDKTLNWLYRVYLNTQLSNLHTGIPSDCPHIERRGYTGDGQLTCRAAMLTLDMKAFYRKWMADISDGQDRITGHVQYTAPYANCGGGPGGWGSAIVELPYRYWQIYGEDEPVRTMFPQMLHWFDFMEKHSENGLVVSDQPDDTWVLGEWCTPETVVLPPPFVNTYFYILSLQKAVEIAAFLKEEDCIPLLKERIESRKKALTAAYFNTQDGNFFGNVQGANAFALTVGLGDERTKENFICFYRNRPCLDTGIFGTELVTRLLFRYGENDLACRLLTNSEPYGFGDWEAEGATTFWEHWKNPRSQNHPMFGAVTACLFEDILGIRQKEGSTGFDRVKISIPRTTFLTDARGSILTPHGKLEVSWRRAGSDYFIDIEVPEGMEAELECGGNKSFLKTGPNRCFMNG